MTVKAKTRGALEKIKAAFKRAFNISKTKNVDFIEQINKELFAEGLTKQDFDIILAATSDCVICQITIEDSYEQYI